MKGHVPRGEWGRRRELKSGRGAKTRTETKTWKGQGGQWGWVGLWLTKTSSLLVKVANSSNVRLCREPRSIIETSRVKWAKSKKLTTDEQKTVMSFTNREMQENKDWKQNAEVLAFTYTWHTRAHVYIDAHEGVEIKLHCSNSVYCSFLHPYNTPSNLTIPLPPAHTPLQHTFPSTTIKKIFHFYFVFC